MSLCRESKQKAAEAEATDGRKSGKPSRSFCHGLTRNFTEIRISRKLATEIRQKN